MRSRYRRCVVLALTLLGVSQARASVIQAMDMKQLVVASDRIVRAHVGQARSLLDEDQRRIVTDFDVRVLSTLKGQRDKALTVRVSGGIIGDRGQRVVGSPLLRRGDEVVLFLQDVLSTPEGKPRCRVVGMARGAYFVRSDPSGKAVVVQRLNGLEVQAPGDPAPRALQAPKPIRRATFFRTLRSLVRKTRK